MNQSFGLGAGAFLLNKIPKYQTGKDTKIPLLVTSHTNETGKKAVQKGMEILNSGGLALDSVEKAANIIELDPEDLSVGYGGLPNEEGNVQLDSSIMDGKTYNAGAVACIENIKTPSSVARIVMEKTDHVMLVGRYALEFAKKWGFKEENLLTDKAREIWLRWKTELSERDDWGPPDHLRNLPKMKTAWLESQNVEYHTGTTNVLAVDKNGDIAGITTTSGLSFKISGRVGDSPIIGAGLYVDNDVGAAGATGRGEDVIKSCASYFIVLRMKEGRTPQQACEDAMKMIVDKYKKINPKFFPGESFVAVNKKGEYGCARMRGRRPSEISVMNESGYSIYKGLVVFPVK
ncbi:MAG: N(4)-(beta-N-acetylglucosaminyl)-L-asparaginase [Candidatus Aminicenantaceae bacterium]